MNKDVYIGQTSIQLGDSGYFNQPKEIIDYIKYQQQENERYEGEILYMSSEIERLKNQVEYWKTKYDELEDYKSKNEKAIEKLTLLIDIGFDYDGFNKVESLKGLIDELVSYARDTRNILQGGDSNEK